MKNYLLYLLLVLSVHLLSAQNVIRLESDFTSSSDEKPNITHQLDVFNRINPINGFNTPLTENAGLCVVRPLGGHRENQSADLSRDTYRWNGQAFVTDFTVLKTQLDRIYSRGFGVHQIVLDNPCWDFQRNANGVLPNGDYEVSLYGNAEPPVSYNAWADYLVEVMEFLIATYGEEEMLKVQFGIGREIGTTSHWSGTQDEFFEFYRRSLNAVRSVLPNAIVGSHFLWGSSSKSWGPDFVRWSAAQNIDYDFVGVSYYPPYDRVDRTDLSEVYPKDFGVIKDIPQWRSDAKLQIHEFALTETFGGNSFETAPREYQNSFLLGVMKMFYENDMEDLNLWGNGGTYFPLSQELRKVQGHSYHSNSKSGPQNANSNYINAVFTSNQSENTFRIFASNYNANPSANVSENINIRSIVNAPAGTEYTYRVATYNIENESLDWSGTLNGTTINNGSSTRSVISLNNQLPVFSFLEYEINLLNSSVNNCTADYEEQNGLVVIEAENRPAVGGWQERTTFSGFTGDGYLEWLGDDNFNNPGEGVISTTIQINDPGRYRFEWRSKVGEGDSPTESNDSWLKFPDASDFYGQQGNSIVYPKGSGQTPVAEGAGGDGYFKIYSSGTTDWTWSTRTSDNDAHNIFVEFDTPGVYTMLVSGRSRHHLIDRITLFKEGVNNRNLSLEETSCDATDNDTNQAPSVSFTSPTNNITLEEGYDDFVVVALPEDSDGTISTTSLFINDQFIRNENLAPYEWGNGNNVDETLNLGVGTHTFRVVATDNDGATAEDTFELTVTAANQPPSISFVDPIGDISLEEGYTALVVDATATDSDGTIAGLELYIDGVLIREEVNAPYIWGTGQNESETLGLTVGDHAFRVVATDDDGATSQDTFILTVTEAPNEIPTVSFTNPTGDLTLQEGYTSLPLEANATDTDGTIVGVELFIDGQSIRTDTTSPYTWGSGTDENETLGVTAGTYTFRIVATDDEGATAEDTFVLTVTELPNEAPTVAFTNPSGDLTVQEGYTSLELTAEALDSDGTIASVGLFIDDVFVRNENVAPYDFGQGLNIDETIGLGVGTYVIKVIATDDDGATSEDTFVLTVTEAPNQIPTVSFTNPTGDLTLQEGYTSLPLEANATDIDGTIASVELFIDGQSIRTDTTSPYTWGSGTDENETLGVTAGIYTFRIVATDDEGATAEDTFVLTVTELPNEAPTVAFTNPAGDLTVQEGYTSLELIAEALDSDGTIASVGLYIDDVFVRNENVAPYDFGQGLNIDETLGLGVGTYVIKVIATDDDGATSEDTFVLTVTEAPNQIPTVSFTNPTGDITLQEGYTSLPLEANATDIDGTIIGVELFIDGQSIRTDTTSPYTWGSGTDENETLGVTAGTYTFRIVATDDEGATAEDTFVLTVTELPNEAPTVAFTNPAGDLSVQEGYTSLELTAEALDSDGTIASVGLFIDGQLIRNDFNAPHIWGGGNDVAETLGLTTGIYTIRVLATDDEGATAEDTFTLTVTELPNEAPTVAFTNPTGDLTLEEGYISLPLEATAMDSDGTIASVELFIDGQSIRTDTMSPYTWGSGTDTNETLGLTVGNYTFRIVATDDEGTTAEDTFILTVTAVAENQVPTVMFSDPSEDLTVQEGYTSLPLEASASDADGTIASVGLYIDGQFIRNDFDAPYTWGSGANQDETLGLAPGVYTLRVLAIDDEGATAEDTILLTVTALPNEAPTVEFTNPTGDLTLEEGYVSLPLTAQALDSDGTIESVGLYIDGVFVRNENGAPYDFGQGNNVAETLGLTIGTYTFRIVATDDEGATAEDTFTLTVTAVAENQVPTVMFSDPNQDLTVQEGYTSLPLEASASDADGTIANVGLYIDGQFIRNDFDAPYTWGSGANQDETLGLVPGIYTLRVLAIDDEGATAEDTILLTVTALPNEAPTVEFTNPAGDLTVQEGYTSLELTAVASDSDGTIVSVGLFIDGQLIRNDFNAPHIWGGGNNVAETLGLTVGSYAFTVIATDDEGATAEDTFTLTVTAVAENQVPTVMFSDPNQDLTVQEGYTSLPLEASASDADGTIASVGLYIDGQFIRNDFDAPYTWGSGANQDETLGLAPGVYTLRVLAIDDEGATAEDTILLTVTALPNEVPTVEFTNPAGDLTLEEGYVSLPLTAQALDSDGTIERVGLYIDGVFVRNENGAPYDFGQGNNVAETLGLTVGSYTFTVIATDDEGATAEDTFTLTVTAVAENQAPGVAFTTPFEETLTVEEGYDSLELVAEAFDDDGSIVSVGLYIDGVFIRNDFESQFNWGIGANAGETLGLTAGTYTFTVIATDNEGATAEDTFILTVEGVLSVDSTISEREISMYPNPAQNQIFISGLRIDQAQVQIIDVLGRVVKVVETISNEQAIDISQLSAAPYIVQISIDNNFVIKHLIKRSNVK